MTTARRGGKIYVYVWTQQGEDRSRERTGCTDWKIELIDIRETYEFSGGSLRTAKNVPMQKLISDPAKYLKKDKTYYLMCQSGARSRMCCGQLTRDGYDVVDVVGGYGMYFGSNRK